MTTPMPDNTPETQALEPVTAEPWCVHCGCKEKDHAHDGTCPFPPSPKKWTPEGQSHSLPGDVGIREALVKARRALSCYRCGGDGSVTTALGEPDECPVCHGEDHPTDLMREIDAALTPSALSGDNSQSSRVDTVQIGLIYGAAVCAVEEAASLPIGEPVALLYENPETGDVEVELFRHGAACLTDADRAAGWTETELYALTTPPTPDRIRKDAVREADVALLGARMVLEGKATNATGALAKSDWKPSRSHIEGMRNTMREAIEYIDEARTALSATPAQEGEVASVHRITRAAAERYSLDIPTLEHFGLLADSLSPAQPVDETERLIEARHLLQYARPLVGIARSMSDGGTADSARLLCQRIDEFLTDSRAALQHKGEVSRG